MTTCKPNFTTGEHVEGASTMNYTSEEIFTGFDQGYALKENLVFEFETKEEHNDEGVRVCYHCACKRRDAGQSAAGAYVRDAKNDGTWRYNVRGEDDKASFVSTYTDPCGSCEDCRRPMWDAYGDPVPTRATYCCGECGSLDVSFVWWHNANPGKDDKVPLPTEMDPTDCSCAACKDDCNIITTDAWEAKQKAEQEAAELAGPYWVQAPRYKAVPTMISIMDENRLLVAECNSLTAANALVKELNQGHAAIRKIQES